MHDGIRLGRLFGVDLTIDYSWVFVFMLMSWNLTVVYSGWHPTWSLAAVVFLAVLAALLFFASVLAHEFAHALVARLFRIPVSGIRLFLFGGVSNIEREPPSAGAEFWMAIVGPLTSFGIGALLLVGAAGFFPTVEPVDIRETLAQLGPIPTLLLWLGVVNIGVGLFNLIPGFPLDGGRILRAAIWSSTRDLHRATFWASSVGQAIGWMFMLMGLAMIFGTSIPFFGRGPASGLWLAFIGWFLRSASERSYRGLLVQDVLEGVRVKHLMRSDGYVLPANTTVSAAVRDWFLRSAEHAYPVVDDCRLVGLVCVGDVRKVPEQDWERTPVTAIMTPADALTVATGDEDASSALRKLARLDVEQLPVVEEGQLVGMLERRDVARWIEIRLGPQRPHAPRTV